jgi:hypothetical protein
MSRSGGESRQEGLKPKIKIARSFPDEEWFENKEEYVKKCSGRP